MLVQGYAKWIINLNSSKSINDSKINCQIMLRSVGVLYDKSWSACTPTLCLSWRKTYEFILICISIVCDVCVCAQLYSKYTVLELSTDTLIEPILFHISFISQGDNHSTANLKMGECQQNDLNPIGMKWSMIWLETYKSSRLIVPMLHHTLIVFGILSMCD